MDLPLWFNTSPKVLVLETLAFPPQLQGVGPEDVCPGALPVGIFALSSQGLDLL